MQTTYCPWCGSTDTETTGKADADEAVLGEEEYVKKCGDCHAEWVRNITNTIIHRLGDPPPPDTARCLSWDWKAQPDMERIAAAVLELSGGTVHLQPFITNGDSYAWTVADRELTYGQQVELFRS